jgi:hypothetical protein|tara:strand:- start:464 stop:685 length:222 start_codon:yes stop_codon:yes gene_type:complete
MEYNHIKDLYHKKRLLELEWEQTHVKEGIYTLNMVRIDEEIRNTISHIKQAEAKEMLHQVKVDSLAPEFSIAG